jgi:hypothetical protein
MVVVKFHLLGLYTFTINNKDSIKQIRIFDFNHEEPINKLFSKLDETEVMETIHGC